MDRLAQRNMQSTRDPDWLRLAVDRHSGPLIRYVTCIIGDADRARDVVQDAFLRLCQEPRPTVEDHLPEWLFTVCRNRALDILRKENRMEPLEDHALDCRSAAGPSPASLAEQRDLHQKVLGLISSLPRNQREVVRLKFQNGLSYQEISRITSLTVTNVGFLIHTAIKTLRRQLQASLDIKV